MKIDQINRLGIRFTVTEVVVLAIVLTGAGVLMGRATARKVSESYYQTVKINHRFSPASNDYPPYELIAIIDSKTGEMVRSYNSQETLYRQDKTHTIEAAKQREAEEERKRMEPFIKAGVVPKEGAPILPFNP